MRDSRHRRCNSRVLLFLILLWVPGADLFACRFSDDCLPTCKGDIVVEGSCNPTTGTCEWGTSGQNCSKEPPYSVNLNGKQMDFQKTCLLSSDSAFCGIKKQDAIAEVLTICLPSSDRRDTTFSLLTETRQLTKESEQVCLEVLEDKTIDLGVGIAFSAAAGTAKKVINLATTVVGELSNQGLSKTTQSNFLSKIPDDLKIYAGKPADPATYCTLYEKLRDVTLPRLETLWESEMRSSRSCRQVINELERQPEGTKRPPQIDKNPPKPTQEPDPPGPEDPPETPTPTPPETPDLSEPDNPPPDEPTPDPEPQPEPAAPPSLTADFSCGQSFELSPNWVLYPTLCYVEVRSQGSTADTVLLDVAYDERILDITFDEQSKQVGYPKTAFTLIFRTGVAAQPQLTPVSITVTHGALQTTIPLTISILAEGLEPSHGSGIRPPAEVVNSNEGEFCVWRSKSFGDPANCFNISTSTCDNPRYTDPAYELVGANLTKIQAALRASALSPYKDNAYGCNRSSDDQENGNDGSGADEPEQPPEDPDSDGDGVRDSRDNCPTVPNPNQFDLDADRVGDICDQDVEGDGVNDSADNCPKLSNPAQYDSDGDGLGDACDSDLDNDGVSNNLDNCPNRSNPDQRDADGDGQGDACDVDLDGDGVRNGADNCPSTPNPDQKNSDSHWMGDACVAPVNASASAGSSESSSGGRGGYSFGDDPGNNTAGVDPGTTIDPDIGGAGGLGNLPEQQVADAGGAVAEGYRDDPILDEQRARQRAEEQEDRARARNPRRDKPPKDEIADQGMSAGADRTTPPLLNPDTTTGQGTGQGAGGAQPQGAKPDPKGQGQAGSQGTGQSGGQGGVDCDAFRSHLHGFYDAVRRGDTKHLAQYDLLRNSPRAKGCGLNYPPLTNPAPGQQPDEPEPTVVTSQCGGLSEAGTEAAESHIVDLGAASGSFAFSYQTYNQEDQISVLYGGSEIYNTGCVGASGTEQLQFSGGSTKVTVNVRPNCKDQGSTQWNFTVSCPQ